MLDENRLAIDFSQEQEAGYKRVFSRSPLLTNLSAGWNGIYLAYDYQPASEMPEVVAEQHCIAIFTEVPTPIQVERTLDGRSKHEQVVQGNIVVAPANISSRAQWDTAGGVILLGIDPFVFAHAVYEAIDPDRVELVPQFSTPDPLVHQMGLALKAALDIPRFQSRLYGETMTNALIVHLLQHFSARKPNFQNYGDGLSKRQLRQVIDYINDHLDQDLGLAQLAAIVQMSSHYFSRLFKQSTGITPHQYVIGCRVERAKQLLLKGELTIAEIARKVGFVDQSHLNRHFKHLTGITPKAILQK